MQRGASASGLSNANGVPVFWLVFKLLNFNGINFCTDAAPVSGTGWHVAKCAKRCAIWHGTKFFGTPSVVPWGCGTGDDERGAGAGVGVDGGGKRWLWGRGRGGKKFLPRVPKAAIGFFSSLSCGVSLVIGPVLYAGAFCCDRRGRIMILPRIVRADMPASKRRVGMRGWVPAC